VREGKKKSLLAFGERGGGKKRKSFVPKGARYCGVQKRKEGKGKKRGSGALLVGGGNSK